MHRDTATFVASEYDHRAYYEKRNYHEHQEKHSNGLAALVEYSMRANVDCCVLHFFQRRFIQK